MPDLILMDIILKSKMDGYYHSINDKDLNIPVIYLTAHFDDKTIQKAKITELFGYIIKPYL